MIDPSDPAFASPATVVGANDWIDTPKSKGISVRTYIATRLFAAMIGICRGEEDAEEMLNGNAAHASVRYADQLIAALNKPTQAGG